MINDELQERVPEFHQTREGYVAIGAKDLVGGLIARLGVGPFSLLVLLMRFVCRTENREDWPESLKGAWKMGLLVASARQGKLAELIGVSREWVNRWMKILVREKAVIPVRIPKRRSLAYFLGVRKGGEDKWLYSNRLEDLVPGADAEKGVVTGHGGDWWEVGGVKYTSVTQSHNHSGLKSQYESCDFTSHKNNKHNKEVIRISKRTEGGDMSFAHTPREGLYNSGVRQEEGRGGFAVSQRPALPCPPSSEVSMGFRFVGKPLAKQGRKWNEKPPKEWNAKDCLEYFRSGVKSKLGLDMLPYFKKDAGQMKFLVENLGGETVKRMIDRLVDGWGDFKRRKEVDATVPSVGLLVGYRNLLFGDGPIGPKTAMSRGKVLTEEEVRREVERRKEEKTSSTTPD